jgi:hypothetical protein
LRDEVRQLPFPTIASEADSWLRRSGWAIRAHHTANSTDAVCVAQRPGSSGRKLASTWQYEATIVKSGPYPYLTASPHVVALLLRRIANGHREKSCFYRYQLRPSSGAPSPLRDPHRRLNRARTEHSRYGQETGAPSPVTPTATPGGPMVTGRPWSGGVGWTARAHGTTSSPSGRGSTGPEGASSSAPSS